jgi:hypothetical protein
MSALPLLLFLDESSKISTAASGKSVISELGNANIESTLTTDQTIFTQDQQLITKKYVDDALSSSSSGSGILPSMRMIGYDFNSVKEYLTNISSHNAYSESAVVAYVNGTMVSGAYIDGVYSPTQNRIYLVPYGQAPETNWHYIDCDTGTIVPYIHGSATSIYGYSGGVYSPTQNRIYFIPYVQAGQANWHYIDCGTGNVIAYSHFSSAASYGYKGGCYSSTHNRIFFIPANYAISATWHYIDCDTATPNVVTYSHFGAYSAVYGAYAGGVYSPTQDRIYLVPYTQGNQGDWHYIDCAATNPTALPYAHGSSATVNAYIGGCYSPIQNRIYLVPNRQASEIDWHYIDCNITTPTVVAYTHGSSAVTDSYAGGCYSPTQNRIYLSPTLQSSETNWHYIDCNTTTPTVVAYTHGSSAVNVAYANCVYSPTQNRIYLVPNLQGDQPYLHYIKPLTTSNVSISFAGSVLMGN